MNNVPVHFNLTEDGKTAILYHPTSRWLQVQAGNISHAMPACEAASLIRFLSLALEKMTEDMK